MKKSFFIALALLGSCVAEQSLCAENQPKTDAQLVNSIPKDGTHSEIDLNQLDEKTRKLFVLKAAWVQVFRKAQTGEISIEIFIYITLELMEELGKSTEPEDKEMYDLCEKIVKNITDEMNQVADQAEAEDEQESSTSAAPAA